MKRIKRARCIGILTSGGDCPGLNAAIRAVVKTAIGQYDMKVVGFLDGFRGLVENRSIPLDDQLVSGILTRGGTILGTSRDKPHKMPVGDKIYDMTASAINNAFSHHIDCLVCLGGGGTQKNALRLAKAGLPVVTLPKTIDNDVMFTDLSFGYDSARYIATEALDRLHTTASSHNRIIICEVMGHKAGWLALGSGVAAGADVILLPEIPYNLDAIADYLRDRRRHGKRFSIVALAEGALAQTESSTAKDGAQPAKTGSKQADKKINEKKDGEEQKDESDNNLKSAVTDYLDTLNYPSSGLHASILAHELQSLTGMETRVTSLGHVQRGGPPTPFDRILCTLLGAKACQLIDDGIVDVMVGYQNRECVAVPLDKVAGELKKVPIDHRLVQAARAVGTCFGDKLS